MIKGLRPFLRQSRCSHTLSTSLPSANPCRSIDSPLPTSLISLPSRNLLYDVGITPELFRDDVSQCVAIKNLSANQRASHAKKEIYSKFSTGKFTESDVDSFVYAWLNDCSVGTVSQLMRLVGKKPRTKSVSPLKKHLPAIAHRLNSLSSSPWSIMHVSFVIYGLQSFAEADDGTLKIVQTMTKVAKNVIGHQTQPSAQNVVMLLIGLQKNHCKQEETKDLLRVIAAMIGKCTDTFKAQDLGSALYGLQGMNSSCGAVRAVLSALVSKVQGTKETLSAQNVGNALYGLQNMSSNCAEVCALLSALIPKIQECKEPLLVQHVSNALYGLQGMSSSVTEVESILSVLAHKVRLSDGIFDSQAVGNALYGLQCMSSDSAAVRRILVELMPKVVSCSEPLSAQAIGNSFHGLQGMSSDYVEVSGILSALMPMIEGRSGSDDSFDSSINILHGFQSAKSETPKVRSVLSALLHKVEGSSEGLSTEVVCSALYGLKCMSTDSNEVRGLLAALSQRLDVECDDVITAHAIYVALYGFQGMSSEFPEVRALLAALAPQIKSCKKNINTQVLFNALYGLQGMSGDNHEVRTILSAIGSKLHDIEGDYNISGIGVALYGLIGVKDTTESQSILRHLLLHAQAISFSTSCFQVLSTEELICAGRNLVLFISTNSSGEKDGWTKILNLILKELTSRNNAQDQIARSAPTKSEALLYSIAVTTLKDSSVRVTLNEHLHNLFESDIVIRVPYPSWEDCMIIDIEVDGIHHYRRKKKLFCMLRDKYLLSKGVVIKRIEVEDIYGMTHDEISTWIEDTVADAVLSRTGQTDRSDLQDQILH